MDAERIYVKGTLAQTDFAGDPELFQVLIWAKEDEDKGLPISFPPERKLNYALWLCDTDCERWAENEHDYTQERLMEIALLSIAQLKKILYRGYYLFQQYKYPKTGFTLVLKAE